MLNYKYNEDNVTFNSVKIPLTRFNEGPLGIVPTDNKGIHYNGLSITEVNPFINVVDIDWNGLELPSGEIINTTSDFVNWIQTLSSKSLLLKELENFFKLANAKEKSTLIYNPDTPKWEFQSIESSSLIIEVTYLELVDLINRLKLSPGQQYRITDYVTKTSLENTISIEKPFDIIVTADSNTTLNSNAKAINNLNDFYFSNSNLSAWELKYDVCFTGDSDDSYDDYTWGEESKGVIYYMKDEFGNEAPYDFKNIKYKYNGNYYFTFNKFIERFIIVDASLSSGDCYNNIIKPYINNDGRKELNFIILGRTKSTRQLLNDIIIENNCSNIIFESTYNQHVLIKGNNKNLLFYPSILNTIVLYNINTSNDFVEITSGADWQFIGKSSNSDSVKTCNIVDLVDLTNRVSYIESTIKSADEETLIVDYPSLPNQVNITYEDLVNRKTLGKLIPGQQYRITDYITSVNSSGYIKNSEEESITINGLTISYNCSYVIDSINKLFDLIVTALSNNLLLAEAKAIPSKNDNYFDENDLTSWELKYCIENDIEKFLWADENGKGVIYYMKDEFGNECSYDFKNIIFNRIIEVTLDNDLNQQFRENIRFYTFSYYKDSSFKDASMLGKSYNNKFLNDNILLFPFNLVIINQNKVIENNTIINGRYNLIVNGSLNKIHNSHYNLINYSNYNNILDNSYFNLIDNINNFYIFNESLKKLDTNIPIGSLFSS